MNTVTLGKELLQRLRCNEHMVGKAADLLLQSWDRFRAGPTRHAAVVVGSPVDPPTGINKLAHEKEPRLILDDDIGRIKAYFFDFFINPVEGKPLFKWNFGPIKKSFVKGREYKGCKVGDPGRICGWGYRFKTAFDHIPVVCIAQHRQIQKMK